MNEFNKHGYVVVRKAYNTTQLWEYCKEHIDEGDFKDEQSPHCPSFYKDIEICKLQIKLLPLMEKTTELKLYPTYTYHRLYTWGGTLKKHTDRPSCEISTSLCLGYEGDYNWPLWITDLENFKEKECTLEPGDMIVYKGRLTPHYRIPYTGTLHGAAFLHYVNQDGPCADSIYDIKQLDPDSKVTPFE